MSVARFMSFACTIADRLFYQLWGINKTCKIINYYKQEQILDKTNMFLISHFSAYPFSLNFHFPLSFGVGFMIFFFFLVHNNNLAEIDTVTCIQVCNLLIFTIFMAILSCPTSFFFPFFLNCFSSDHAGFK